MERYTAQQLLSPEHAGLFEEIVSLLTLSFTDDPVHRWLLTSQKGSEYVETLRVYARMMLRLCCLSDASTTTLIDNSNTTSTLQAVSIVIPPHGNATFDSTITAVRAGAIGFMYRLGFGLTYRLMTQFMPSLQKMHDELFPNPSTKWDYYHLMYIAAHPECQGKGLGARLLLADQDYVKSANEAAAQKAVAQGKDYTVCPLYLESSSVNSKRLYQRLGFEHRGSMAYGKAGEQEAAVIAEDGTVLGGKQFGMFWSPQLTEVSPTVT